LHLDWLYQWGINIDDVRGLTATAYVDDAQFADLTDAGFEITAIPNQARRAFLASRQDRSREAYHTYETLTTELQQIATDNPSIVTLSSIGLTVQGRELWMMKISDNVEVDEPEPEFLYIATIHGDEPVGTELTIYLIRRLVRDYGGNPDITALIDNSEIWICPMYNPDGNAAGARNNAQGLDLNRNFPDPVDDPIDDPFGHPVEVQQMMYFYYDHNFLLGACFHTGALVVNYPWDSITETTPDHDMIHNLALGYSVRNPPMWNSPTFPNGVVLGWEWYVIHGGIQDWAYNWRNEVLYTIELNNVKWPNASQLAGLWDDNEESMLWLMEQVTMGVEGYVTDAVDGSPIEADFDVVEIGKPMWGEPIEGYYHRLLEAGTYTLEFSAFGYNTHTEPGVVVTAGTVPTQLDVAMNRTARFSISGLLTEAGSGMPLSGQVAVYRHDTGELFRVVEAGPATGAYDVEVPVAELDFVASSDDHVSVVETRNITGNEEIDFSLPIARGEVLLVLDSNTSDNFRADLADLEYLVTEETIFTTHPETWGDYDLVVWSAGSYKSPVATIAVRDALEAYVTGGGKLLVEGGEIGYDAAQSPGYPSFASTVLHISGFDTDNAGDLEVRPDQTGHALVTTPNALPGTLDITYDYFGDQDAVSPAGDATLIYGTASHPTDAGILVYDTPARSDGQIVFYAFDYAALTSPATAKDLLENTLEYLGAGAQGVAELPQTLRLSLSRPHPSVTRSGAVFAFSLPEAGRARVDVYDAGGRRVRTLLQGVAEAGSHLLTWDGRDERGADASAGVYFLKAVGAGQEVSRRLVVVE
ncbi:M14 family zinc carboxypeptidase, partial [Candidatus Eisenbacteria bacterium]